MDIATLWFCFLAGLMVLGVIALTLVVLGSLAVLCDWNPLIGGIITVVVLLAVFTFIGCGVAAEQGWIDSCPWCAVIETEGG